MTDYTLIRSKRRTLAIHIRDNAVEVRAPMRLNQSEIDQFVLSRQEWIDGKLMLLNAQAKRRESFSLHYGDFVAYRGRNYPIAADGKKRARFDGGRFIVPDGMNSAEIKQACVKIYRTLAKRDFTEKIDVYGKIMGAVPSSLRVTGAKTRWGSCSAKKSVNFSWRLIMACDEVINYVVVHELAHLFQMNHSARFWAVVEKVLPDYRERRAKLKELQRRLNEEDWD